MMKTEEMKLTASRVLSVEGSRKQILQCLMERRMVPSLVEHAAMLALCEADVLPEQLTEAQLQHLDEDTGGFVEEFFELPPVIRTQRWASLMNRTSRFPTSMRRINQLEVGLNTTPPEVANGNLLKQEIITDVREIFLAPLQSQAVEERKRVERLREAHKLSAIREEMKSVSDEHPEYCRLAESFCKRAANIVPLSGQIKLNKSFGESLYSESPISRYVSDTSEDSSSRATGWVVVFVVIAVLRIGSTLIRNSPSSTQRSSPGYSSTNPSPHINTFPNSMSRYADPFTQEDVDRNDKDMADLVEKYNLEGLDLDSNTSADKLTNNNTSRSARSLINLFDRLSEAVVVDNGKLEALKSEIKPIDPKDPQWQITYDLAAAKMSELRQLDPSSEFLRLSTDSQLMSIIMTNPDGLKYLKGIDEKPELIDELHDLGHLIGHEPRIGIPTYSQDPRTTP